MKTTRLEFVKGSSRKFWEVSTKGRSVVVRFGRIGTEGQTKTKACASDAKAEASAEALLRQKLAKGYTHAGAAKAAARPSTPPAAAKRAVTGEQAIVEAFHAWLNAAAARLKTAAPALRSTRYSKGVIEITRADGKKVRGRLSAPVSLLGALWRDDVKMIEAIYFDPRGRWNDVVTLLRCDGAAHDRYTDLVAALHDGGFTHEARLAWCQAMAISDPDDRKQPIFRALFPKLPPAAGSLTASSAAALMKRRLPLARSKDPIDAFAAANDIYNFAGDALQEVSGSGKRESDLVAEIEAAIAVLAKSPELAVRDMARLVRQTFACHAAVLLDEPR